MSVLEQSDESRIIRDAARAWARGDIPLEDYRMIRRATLDGICGTQSDDDDPDNDTAPNDDTEVVEPGAVSGPPARSNMPLMIGGAVVVAIVVALALALL